MSGKRAADSKSVDDKTDDDDLDIDSETDYGFVIGSNGQLKTFFLPEDDSVKPPKEVLRVLKIFKIADIDALRNFEPVILH